MSSLNKDPFCFSLYTTFSYLLSGVNIFSGCEFCFFREKLTTFTWGSWRSQFKNVSDRLKNADSLIKIFSHHHPRNQSSHSKAQLRISNLLIRKIYPTRGSYSRVCWTRTLMPSLDRTSLGNGPGESGPQTLFSRFSV